MSIAIYGGTFDPVHTGHVNVCKQFLKQFSVEKLYIIPAFIPPHKEIVSKTTPNQRFEMSKIAFSDLSDKIVISDMEIKREGKSFTSDTIKSFKKSYDGIIYLICGTDMYLTLETWHEFEYIFKNSIIVCARRENSLESNKQIDVKTREYKEKYNAKIEFLNGDYIEISSSDVRENLKKYKDKIPDSIYDYIIKNHLYNS